MLRRVAFEAMTYSANVILTYLGVNLLPPAKCCEMLRKGAGRLTDRAVGFTIGLSLLTATTAGTAFATSLAACMVGEEAVKPAGPDPAGICWCAGSVGHRADSSRTIPIMREAATDSVAALVSACPAACSDLRISRCGGVWIGGTPLMRAPSAWAAAA